MDSILTSIKSLLGIQEEYTHFDKDIIIHINSVFFILAQLGVNPTMFFSIKDSTTKWNDYILDNPNLEIIISYMYIKVRIIFDPPLSNALLEALKTQANEYEWRIMISVDPKPVEEVIVYAEY